MQQLSVTEMRTFRRCARERFYAYELQRESLDLASALSFGRLIHLGLETWWILGGRYNVKWFESAFQAMQTAATSMRGVDEFDLARAEELLLGYHARWVNDTMRVVSVEKRFTIPLVNPETGWSSNTFELVGKTDLVVDVGSPSWRYIVEHKTCSEDIGVGSVYWQCLQLDSQASVYYSSEPDAVALIYDVIRKPGQRPSLVPIVEDGAKVVVDANGTRVRTKDGKKWRETGDASQGYVVKTRLETVDEYRDRLRKEIADNPEKYYQRATVVRLENDVREAAFDTWQTARAIRDAQLAKRWPRNPDACRRYGHMCQYWGVCTGAESIDDDTKFRTKAARHEELEP
jgi:hypothetical protein